MSEIYKCKRIAKWRDGDYEKGDVGYIMNEDLPYLIGECRIILGNVAYWEEEITDTFKKNKEKKIDVIDKYNIETTILCSMEEFDKVMEEYLNNKKNFNFN